MKLYEKGVISRFSIVILSLETIENREKLQKTVEIYGFYGFPQSMVNPNKPLETVKKRRNRKPQKSTLRFLNNYGTVFYGSRNIPNSTLLLH